MQEIGTEVRVFTGGETKVVISKRSVVLVTVDKDGYLTAETLSRPGYPDVSIPTYNAPTNWDGYVSPQTYKRMCEDYAEGRREAGKQEGK
jgi:hypothetical protein